MYLFCACGVCECRNWSTERLWKREENLKELVLLLCVGPGTQTQVSRQQALYQLSHLASL